MYQVHCSLVETKEMSTDIVASNQEATRRMENKDN